jgi:hypothetical protein
MRQIEITCTACGGTGLYRGSREWGDCAVICGHCSGTGGVTISYEPFEGRRPAQHVKRVFLAVEGARHAHKDQDGIRYSRGGCPYASWIKGAEPQPVRDLYCPCRWTGRLMAEKSHPAHAQWEQMCADHLADGCPPARCPRHQDPEKLAACWRRYDELVEKGKDR